MTALFGLAACSSEPQPEQTSSPDDSSGTEGSETSSTSSSATTSSGATSPSTTSLSSTTETGAHDSEDVTDDGTGGDDDADLVGCPAVLPGDWVLCESFDTITDPWNQLGAFISIDGALAVEEGPARSGRQALRIRQTPDIDWGGWAALRFGRGPASPVVHAQDEDFDEVWVRFWTRTPPEWPDGGMGDLVEVQALSTEESAIAADATILGPTGSTTARLIGWSCVHDGQLLCDGINDWGNPNLVARAFTSGVTPLFSTEYGGDWHCAVLHVRLDQPGSSDGQISLRIDGELDAQLDDLELIGNWPGTRLNAVKFSSWWPDVPYPLERHIDDVVVATTPLSCPELR